MVWNVVWEQISILKLQQTQPQRLLSGSFASARPISAVFVWVRGLEPGRRMYKLSSHLWLKETAAGIYWELEKKIPQLQKYKSIFQKCAWLPVWGGYAASVMGVKWGRAEPRTPKSVWLSVMQRDGKQQHTCASDRALLSPNGCEYFIFHSAQVSEGLDVAKIHLLLFCMFSIKRTILLCVYLHTRTPNVKEWHPLHCIILLCSSHLGACAFCWIRKCKPNVRMRSNLLSVGSDCVPLSESTRLAISARIDGLNMTEASSSPHVNISSSRRTEVIFSCWDARFSQSNRHPKGVFRRPKSVNNAKSSTTVAHVHLQL